MTYEKSGEFFLLTQQESDSRYLLSVSILLDCLEGRLEGVTEIATPRTDPTITDILLSHSSGARVEGCLIHEFEIYSQFKRQQQWDTVEYSTNRYSHCLVAAMEKEIRTCEHKDRLRQCD